MKRTVSRDQSTVVGAAMNGVGMSEKDIKGTDETIDGLTEGLQEVKDAAMLKPDAGLSLEDRTALEEENAPLVNLDQSDEE